MLRNYLKLAIRNLRRRPGYAFINTFGLAVGMACCLLIGLYVTDELSFDRFHEHADRLFVVVGEHDVSDRTQSTEYSVATELTNGIAEIEQTARVWGGEPTPVIRTETQFRAEGRVLLAEPSLFEMFSFGAVSGGVPASVLESPDGAVVTRSMARRYFGDDNPIGRSLEFYRTGNNVHTVTIEAIVDDPPANSSIQFDVVAPLSLLDERMLQEGLWGFSLFDTYVLTSSPMTAKDLSTRITSAMADIDIETTYGAIPLTELHLSGLHGDGMIGRRSLLYLFGTIALIVLLIAAVNYVNLLTAQAAKRAREIGVRKSLGAARGQLARQFLGESALMSVAALGGALLLTFGTLPAFEALFDKQISLTGGGYALVFPILCVFVVLVSVAAGLYPAAVLARFRPVDVLRGREGGPQGSRMLRSGLVVSQFAISAVLIIGTLVIHKQLDYVQNRSLGFYKEQIVIVDLPRDFDALHRETLKQQVLSHHGIARASVSTGVPGLYQMGYTETVEEAAPEATTIEQNIRFRPAVVDEDYISMLQIPFLAGRNFSDETDPRRSYILNRVAANRLGWTPADAVGKIFSLGPTGVPPGEVIGVVENFHIDSMHETIQPVVLMMNDVGLPFSLVARLVPGQTQVAMQYIETAFGGLAPESAFQFHFLDQVFDQMYRAEERLSRILTTFAGIAILIACLGLFGLAAFSAEQRTKEIGIRKVMGASIADVVGLLSRDFVALVLLGYSVAVVPAYLVIRSWLEHFAYRVDVGVPIFAAVAAGVLLIALLTVSYQAIRAGMADPVKCLRSE